MTAQWYLLRNSARTTGAAQKTQPLGPMPAAKLVELASSGGASAADWVWMEGMDVQITVEKFLAIARAGKLPDSPAAFLPEWLTDVAKSESFERARPEPIPDWLEEMRQAEKQPRNAALPPTADEFTIKGLPLDWLDDIRQIEESLRGRAAPTVPPPQRPTAAPPQPPLALPVSAEPRGFDLATGQILDPVAYDRWQKAEAQRRNEEAQKQPTVSVAEAFLDAQRSIQAWVDDDANKPLVTSGDVDAIQRSASVHEILRRYEGYGHVMREKLLKRLTFLVENRQKFFKAFG
ncbi:MAG: hypothetical protein K2R98_05430 [Gemmataceae bacterium]|nr:hypothetical protein [Gemmataceae bacterium]